MKLHVSFRKVHHWVSAAICLPLSVMICAGLLLMLKKDVDWIQPPTQTGASKEPPTIAISELFAAARQSAPTVISSWGDLERVDLKPDKGVVKFVTHDNWEVQVDATTARVLQTAYRRSDLIEGIHDGSFFAGWVKSYIFLPSGIALLALWITGVYLFVFIEIKKALSRNRQRAHARASASNAHLAN